MLPDDQGQNITLFNFDEPFAENSKYVLTSPRSLKACQIVGIKPVELLGKSLSEFDNEYSGRLSYDLITERYQKYEQRRLGILRRCRDERSRIIDEENEIQDISVKERRTGKISEFLDGDSEMENVEIGASRSRNVCYVPNINKVNGFQPTESTPKRSKARKSLSGTDSARSSPRSPRSPRPSSQMLSSSYDGKYGSTVRLGGDEWRTLTEPRPYISKESAMQRHGWDSRSLKMGSPSLPKSKSPSPQRRHIRMQRTLSVDNILSDLPPHLQKGAARLSENDQKILNIMVSKANKEEVERRLQAARKQELAEEQEAENALKMMQSRRHQMQLAEKMRESEEVRELHRRRLTAQKEAKRRLIESEIQSKNEYWLKEIRKQLVTKNNALLMKSVQREERKRIQERNLARANEEKDFLRNMTHTGLVDRHENATNAKEMQTKLAKSHQALKNFEEKERHEMKMEETKRRLREDQKALQSAIEAKHRQAEMNNRYLRREFDHEMASNKYLKQRKKEQQEESLKKMQKDLEIWQKELQRFQSQNEERALETAKKTSYLKGKKAMMDRLQKEHEHIINKQRIKQDEKARLAELETSVKEKDMKSQLILDEKKNATMASREAALASRTIRNLIKEKTVKSSFDKMASEAELMARIEKKGFRK